MTVAQAPTQKRTYWQVVLAACAKRLEATGEDFSPDAVHWMILVLAGRCNPIKAALQHASVNTTVAWGERLFEEHRSWVVEQLVAFTEGRLTPRPVDNLYGHERVEGIDGRDDQFSIFLFRETENAGRGTVIDATKFLARRAVEMGREEFKNTTLEDVERHDAPHLALKLSRIWGLEEDGPEWALHALRPYLESHPTTLAPLRREG